MKALPFFKNLSYLLVLNVLIKPLWIFGVDRQVQNSVGHEAYGVYFSLLNLSLVFSFITDAGLSNMMNRQLASGIRYNIAQLLRLKAALAAGYSLLVMGTAWLWGVRQWRLLLFVVSLQVLLSFFNFFRSLLTAHQLFRQDAWLSVVDKGLLLLLFLPLLHTQLFQIPITLFLFLQAQLACTATAVCAALFVLLKNKALHTAPAVQNIRRILKTVAPYALLILLMATHNRLDGFLLERLHRNGAFEAGVYAAAYRLLDAANMMGYLVASFLVPFIARHQTDVPLVRQTVLTARFGLLLLGSFAALFVGLFAVPLQRLLYPQAALYTAHVIQGCIAVLPAYLLLHVYGSLLTAMGQLKLFIILLAAAVVMNSSLNVLLIPKWGALGCCMAAISSQYACAAAVYFVATKKSGIGHGVKQGRFLFVALLFLAALLYIGRWQAVSPVLLLASGGAVAMLTLFAYLPFLKRYFILFR